jgi:hypothetical protein
LPAVSWHSGAVEDIMKFLLILNDAPYGIERVIPY